MLKRLFIKQCRYPISVGGMMLGIIIAYFSFSFAMQMVREEYLESKDYERGSKFESVIGVNLMYQQDGESILREFADNRVNSYISSVSLFFDELKTECLVNVYLSLPEEFPYQIIEGNMPTKEQLQTGERIIVLGRGQKYRTYRKDKADYVKVCGEEYRVLAYVAAENSKSLDHLVLLFYDALGEQAKSDIDYCATLQGITIYMKSSTQDLMQLYKEKVPLVKEKVLNISSSTEIGEDMFWVDTGLVEYQRYAYLLYGFTVVLIVMIMEFWMAQRRKEFAIRRAVGYSKLQLIRMIACELLKMIVCAGVFLFVIQFINQQVNDFAYGNSQWISDLGICILFIICTFVLLMIYPIYKIMNGSIIATIQDKGV